VWLRYVVEIFTLQHYMEVKSRVLGSEPNGQCSVPTGLENVAAVYCGHSGTTA
jgi:putative hemolysin